MNVPKTLKRAFRHRWFIPLLLVFLVLGFFWRIGLFNPLRPTETVRELGGRAVDVLTGGGGFSFDENTPGYENYKQLMQGCPIKDCIPSIDDPQFESAKEASAWLEDEDVVFALDYKGEQRAYPQRILNWHEIVNDVVAGDPVTITFCPLCGSALTFDRKVDGQVLEFGISGKLHNNDLIMYDRKTDEKPAESLWQQITGEAIVGELFGKRLRQIPMDTLRWGEWRGLHPKTTVLSRNTGFSRDYGRYPYGDYEQSSSLLFPVEGGVDTTLHPKAVVFGVEVNGRFTAYPEDVLQADADGVISDSLGGARLRITYNQGTVTVENLATGDEIVTTRLFWFAWKAFHSDTELYQ